ncbi:hypothetical protein HD554DRAFT_2180077 [Boletus coccyginus]|nr:hypothetical protein HD554DRAFT_2180077 [Boletus coccyginus]
MSSTTPPQRSDNDGPQPYLVLSGEDGGICCLEYLPDGRRIVTGAWCGTVRVWNLESGEQEGKSMKHKGELGGLGVARDGTKIISCHGTGYGRKTKVWNVESQSHKLVEEWTHREKERGQPRISISPDDRLVAIGRKNVDIYTMEGRCVNSVQIGSVTVTANFDMPHNTVHSGSQVSPLNPPPPYSVHINRDSAEQLLYFDPNVFTTPDPITSSVVPSSHPSPPIRSSNFDENDSLETSSMSDQVDLQRILPDLSLEVDECQRIFTLRLRKLLDLATLKGLHAPRDLIHSSLPPVSRAELANIVVSCQSPTHATDTEPSTSVFRSTSDADSKKTRKIDEIKKKLVAMLREIGFGVPKDRLPWSTLEGELEKRGYTIFHWPQGVIREKYKGVYSLGAEEADKLYHALFVDERPVQFVRHDDENGERTTLLPETAPSDDAYRSCMTLTDKQPGFRMITEESFSVERPPKRPRHV